MRLGLWFPLSAILAGAVLAGCASGRPAPVYSVPPPPPPPNGLSPESGAPGSSAPGSAAQDRSLGERCGPNTACAPRAYSARRQYFDQHHRRYYYYDPMKRRYFWENGEPKR